MLVQPRPGVRREDVLEALRDVHQQLENVRATTGPLANLYVAYIEWAVRASQKLGFLITSVDVERLVLTKRYWHLQNLQDHAGSRPLTQLLNAEIDMQVRAFQDTRDTLTNQIRRWSRSGVFVVADTSFYITHPEKLEEVDFRDVLTIREEPVHLLIPILVVDELDSLKRSSNSKTRWRAAYSLAVLDRVIKNVTQAAVLETEDFSSLDTGGIPRGEITVEIVFDPPGHVRLPINDDEIVDRTVAAQALAGRAITVVTYDTGQAMRARAAGLDVKKLRHEAENAVDDRTGQR